MQAAADVGEAGEPRFGQGNRRQPGRLHDLAALGQIDQPVLLAGPHPQQRGRVPPGGGTDEALGQMFLKLSQTGFFGHRNQGRAAIFFSSSSGLTGLTT